MRLGRGRRRLAISEVLGSLIMIGITLVSGAAVFGFVNGQSGTSSQAVAKSAASNINFLNEREVVVYAAIQGASPSSTAQLYVYNNGAINPEVMNSVLFYDTLTSSNVCTVALPSNPIATTSVAPISVIIPAAPTPTCPSPSTITSGFVDGKFHSGHSYFFKVIGTYGSTSFLTSTL